MNDTIKKAVASRMKLAQFSTGAWRPTRTHQGETAEENKRHGLNGEARVAVTICSHPALYGTKTKQGLFAVHSAAGSYHKSVTLPTCMEGMRLLRAGDEFTHSQQMMAYHMRHDLLVAEFIADYEAEKALAPTRLKKLFDPAMWPDQNTVASKFKFAVRYLPCPVDGEWGDWMEESAGAAQSELMDRLVEAGRNLAEICGRDGKLYQATLDNLADVCAMVSDGFNLTEDPIIAEAAKQLAKVTDAGLDAIKESKKGTKSRVDEILDVFGKL